MLTNSATADTIIGTSGNDTVTGASGTVANTDIIIDQSTTDNDVANLTVTGAYVPSNITNIERVNIDWDAFGTAAVTTTGITGAKEIVLTSAKVGFLGSATITDANANTITAGSGMVGTLTVNGAEDGVVVNGGAAKTVVVAGTTANGGAATVTAGASTTSVTISGFETATVNAGTAKTIAVADEGNTTDSINLTVNADATITNTMTGALKITASDTNDITMNALGASTDIAGSGNVILRSTGLDAKKLTNSKTDGTLTVISSATAAQNLAKVEADLFKFTGNVNGALTFATGANVALSAATTLVDVTVTGTGTNDVVNLEVSGTAPTMTDLTLSGVETLNLTANATTGAGNDLVITKLDLDGNKVVISGTNDISVGNITNAGTVDASAVVGKTTFTQVAASTSNLNIVTGSGDSTSTGTVDDEQFNVTGGAGADTVVTVIDAGSTVANLGEGKNSVTAAAIADGTLVVNAGADADTVSIAGSTLVDGSVSLNLGNGNNIVTLSDGGLNGATIVVTTGSGDDKVTITTAMTTTSADTLNLNLGTGSNTLTLADNTDFTLGTIELDGVSIIQLAGTADTGNATFQAADISGKTFTVKSDGGNDGDGFTVVGVAATTKIDLSTLTIDRTIDAAMSATTINGSAGTGAQTIKGTLVADTITGGAGNDVITGGKGADVITGGAGADTLIFGNTDSGITFATADTVNGFVTGSDKLSLGVAGDATANTGNYVELADADYNTFADLLTAANTALNTLAGTSSATELFVFAAEGTDADVEEVGLGGYLFNDTDGDGDADQVIFLAGLTSATFAASDIIA